MISQGLFEFVPALVGKEKMKENVRESSKKLRDIGFVFSVLLHEVSKFLLQCLALNHLVSWGKNQISSTFMKMPSFKLLLKSHDVV